MKKILIVDDAQFMREMTADMLSDEYETIGAASGDEALRICESEHPDLILTDLVMPGMSGLEFQRLLSENDPDHVPVVFISADENQENELRGLENGAVDFIRKPLRKDVLLQRVGNILRQVEHIRRLKLRAETDPMTGLLNKTRVTEILTERCHKGVGTLMIVDLDDFKLVNDLFGHSMGDRVLIDFAQILKSVIRASDVAGRIGGDEFIVFCQDVREEEIIAEKTRRMSKLLLDAAHAAMGPDMGIPLGVSAGAVRVPDDGADYDTLFPKADRALYRVKQNGKHGYAFFEQARQTGGTQKSDSPVSTLKGVQIVLEERSRAKGAFSLGFEDFRNIYRFARRTIESYHHPVELALFTLHMTPVETPSDSAPNPNAAVTNPNAAVNPSTPDSPNLQDVMEQFGATLATSLRRSDAFTHNGKNQYLVLLSGLDDENEETILNRISARWNEHPLHTAATVTFETVPLRP